MSRALPCLMLLPWLLGGCLNVDFAIYGGIPCGQVGPETCEGFNQWDAVCLSCDEPYDWARAFDWFDTMLEDGDSVRPIPEASVVRALVPTDDGLGELDTYFIPAHGQNAELSQTTIFYNHGNYAGIEHYVPRLQVLHELGYNVFVWDYRGFGKSKPDAYPTDEQFLADAQQMRAYVNTLAPAPDRIIIYAYSLGGIPAIEAAVTDPGCALFLEAPFTSASEVLADAGVHMPESMLSAGRFNNPEKVRGYDGPLFVMIGEDDSLFSPESVREIFDAAPSDDKEMWVLPNTDHGISTGGVVEASMRDYEQRMRTFLQDSAPQCIGARR